MLKHSVNFLAGFMLSLLCFTASDAPAAPLQLSQVPLYLGGNIGPNVMFTLDDSGSMQWEVLPDEQLEVPGDVGREINYVFPENQAYYGSGYYSCDDRNTGTTNCVDTTAAVGGHEDDPNYPNQHHYMTRSYYNNKAYYNPSITYSPWRYADNTSYPNATITCAYHNPQNTALGCRNLEVLNDGGANTSTDSYGSWRRLTSTGSYQWRRQNYVNAQTGVAGFWPAVYFNFDSSNAGCDGQATTRACYDKVEIRTTTTSYAGSTSRTDCAAKPTCTYAEEIQNFANWYTYYRSRVLTARAGVGRAFAAQSSDPTSPSILRVGFSAINKGSAPIDGLSSPGAVINGVRKFTGADRTNFFSSLYGHAIPKSSTPLRRALDDVGKYFERTDPTGPWTETPGTASTTPERACRQSYDILTTDGYWNGASAPTAGARANVDNTAGVSITNHTLNPTPPTYQYTAANPYKDTWGDPNPSGGTLADIAMYYWNRDLHPTLLNKVLTNPADPAFWQHMVTHTVGLGLSGTLDPAADLPALTAGTKTWPQPCDGCTGENLDDLWHAAVNGRGEFFSAADPELFASSLSSILSTIVDRNSSAASVALNSGSITSDSHLYQAKFNTSNWSGQLLSIPINTNGTIPLKADGTADEDWDAAVELDAQNPDSRRIVTYKSSAAGTGSPGIPFRWPADPLVPGPSELDPSQVSALNTNPATGSPDLPTPLGSERLDYLRGKAVSGFRTRTSRLGDSVYSSPAYVGEPQARYENWRAGDPETGTYSAFESSKAGRAPMVYVGANDGMLHGFDAGDGSERFAYVPASVFKNLNKLTSPTYNHRFYVDGSPIVGDAFFGGSWHTVLVGGLRGGGQGIYALDITDPPKTSPPDTEAGIAAKVLWEFTDADDPITSTKIEGDVDLGYTYSDPNIVRMHNGKWAAVFGSGYNNTESDGATTTSTTGNAVLYIVDIADGSLMAKLDTKEGSAQDPTGSSRPNGLATAAPIDANGDYIVDYIYAGDLFGNLWKFDVTSSNDNDWKVAYGSTTPDPLFTACFGTSCTTGATSNYQPITTRPQVGRHPTEPLGFMVYFGTGKYFESGDATPTGQTTQSFYGIWDQNPSAAAPFGRSKLQEQKILKEVPQTFGGASYELRVTEKNPVDYAGGKLGWYMDLFNQEGGNTNNFGEKQVTDSILRNDRIIFTTLIPSVDPCDFGGTGWLMELDAGTGGQLSFSPFDLNLDGLFDQYDYVDVDLDGDGVKEKVPASGKKSKEGIIAQPGVVAGTGKDDDKEYKFSSGSTGNIERTVENAGPGYAGRTSWRELKQ
ncbi:MAG: pilus assembly protein [Gammaproteobacteria bacterium]